MIRVQPYERCPLKVGILIDGDIVFYKFGPDTTIHSVQELADLASYNHNVSPVTETDDNAQQIDDPLYFYPEE